jgi:hypothetical protein
VPEAERGRVKRRHIRILNGSLFELTQPPPAPAGLKPLAQDEVAPSWRRPSFNFRPTKRRWFDACWTSQVQASAGTGALEKTIVYPQCI